MSLTSNRLVIPGLFLLAVVLRLVVVSVLLPDIKPEINPDGYRALASNLLAGKGFVRDVPESGTSPCLMRTPGYPLFLSGLMVIGGDSLPLFLYAQCVAGALICVLVYLIGLHLLGLKGGILAGLLCAIDPNSVIRCADLRPDTLFTLVFSIGVLLVVWREQSVSAWFLAGLLWGYAVLIRPIAIFWWFPAVVFIFLYHLPRRLIPVFAVAFLLMVTPWFVRNHHITGHWFMSTISTSNLLHYRAGGVIAFQKGIPLEAARTESYARYGDLDYYDGQEAFDRKMDLYPKEATKILLGSPGVTLRLTIEGFLRILVGHGADGLHYALKDPRPLGVWWPKVYTLLLCASVILSLLGGYRLGWRAWWPVVIVLYFVLLASAPEGGSRFRLPAMPGLAVLVAAGWSGVMEWIRRKPGSLE